MSHAGVLHTQNTLLVVQYSGDYRDAYQRIQNGTGETYFAHGYVLNSLNKIGQENENVDKVVVLHCYSNHAYDEQIMPHLRIISTGLRCNESQKSIIPYIKAIEPRYLVVFCPLREIFVWATSLRIRTLGIFADSFMSKTWRQKISHFRLRQTLNHQNIEWLANHGINACRSLDSIGVNPQKIIPWDWPQKQSPANYSPKGLRHGLEIWNLVYVGSLQASKGVGDILQAMAGLQSRGIMMALKVAGQGNLVEFQTLAAQLGVQEQVEFLGAVPNHDIVDPLMRQADCVVIPSRHEYPEGLPLTIYEALTSRTPIVASDHPMFMGNLEHGVSALIFRAGDSTALAREIERLLTDNELYQSLSTAAEQTWQKLQIPTKWADLINYWLDDSEKGHNYLHEYCLASGRYDAASQ